tara:strand:- start:165 stop:641 length:477 start_codon:yes stop_codon:yes gene_type:complete
MAKAQMAGKLLQYLTKGLRGADGAIDMGQVGIRVVPDAVFGGLAAVQTPGDLGDKLIAGTTSAIGGSLGGLALGGLSRNQLASMALDTAGSLGGDMLAYQAGEQLMRAKDKLSGGKGRTPYERMGDQERAIYEEQLRRQIMAQYGLLPGSREQYAGMG